MQFFVVAALLAVAAADSAPSYHAPVPAYHAPAPAYHQPAHKSYDAPANYNYEYKVDGYGDYEPHFNAQESRDGYATRGSYSVALPDGRIQTVNYNTADAYSGNVAEVTYSGDAKYPTYHPAPVHKAATYHPAPVHKAATYHPAPAHKAAAYHPAPVHKAATYHPAPAHKAAAYHPAPVHRPAKY